MFDVPCHLSVTSIFVGLIQEVALAPEVKMTHFLDELADRIISKFRSEKPYTQSVYLSILTPLNRLLWYR